MAGSSFETELLKVFPKIYRPSVSHARSRTTVRKTKGPHAHGRARGSHLTAAAKRDPFKHKAQAKGQG